MLLLVKSAKNEHFESFYLKTFIFHHYFFEENETIICSPICFSLIIIDLKMIARQLLGPPNLTKAQTLHIHKSIEFIMVSKNKDFVFAAFKVMALSFKSFNNGQKFIIISFVSSFVRNHFLKIIGHWVPSAQVDKLT